MAGKLSELVVSNPAAALSGTDPFETVQAGVSVGGTYSLVPPYVLNELKDTDGTLAANSDAKFATQKATKTYVDQIVAAQDAMVYKGVIDCSANPNYPAADRGWTYRVSVAGKIGGASGVVVQVSDIAICLTDGTVSGNQATVGANWNVIQANLDGALLSTDIGVTVQAYDADLTAIAALTSAADKVPYATGAGTWSLATVTAAARTVLDDTTTDDMLTTLGALPLAGGAMTGGITALTPAGATYVLEGETGVSFTIGRYANSNTGVNAVARKSRGTSSVPAILASNDTVLNFEAQGYNGASYIPLMRQITSLIEATPSATAMQGNWRISLTAAGAATLTEVLRLDTSAGLQMFGANQVINSSRHFVLRSYTRATLPSASPAGQLIQCSDLGGGAGMLVSDGTFWRLVDNNGYGTSNSNVDFTMTVLTNVGKLAHIGTLTADRTITLSTTNAYLGATFTFTRTGAGAFNLNIGGLKNLVTNTWCEVTFNGTAWILTAYGAL